MQRTSTPARHRKPTASRAVTGRVVISAGTAVAAVLAAGAAATAVPTIEAGDKRAEAASGNATTCGSEGKFGVSVGGQRYGIDSDGEYNDPSTVVSFTKGTLDQPFLNISAVKSGFEVLAVIVKGGNGYNLYERGMQTQAPQGLGELPWNDLRSPANAGDGPPDISHWFVCVNAVANTAAAEQSVEDVEDAKDAADNAEKDAKDAKDAADKAEKDAEDAAAAAEQAAQEAKTAQEKAAAEQAAQEAADAQAAADQAAKDAADAQKAAEEAAANAGVDEVTEEGSGEQAGEEQVDEEQQASPEDEVEPEDVQEVAGDNNIEESAQTKPGSSKGGTDTGLPKTGGAEPAVAGLGVLMVAAGAAMARVRPVAVGTGRHRRSRRN
ncbi:MAG: hypothetical protein ACT4P1_13505 [Sporichthyaceae bacterium]